ncbi:transposase [Streptacidiphilus sp. N1-12]|uniref:Transposase n=2 Tax=Streptacidiphilus alkalitolerans TaxID=3342712 RepID=A0ABV6VKA2_9ACTN
MSPPRRTTTVSGARSAGLTTKLHLAVEQGQRPLALLVTAGQWHDSPQCQPVLERIRVPRTGPGRPRTGPNRVRADRAHGSRGHRVHLRRRGIKCTSALLPAGWSSAWTYPHSRRRSDAPIMHDHSDNDAQLREPLQNCIFIAPHHRASGRSGQPSPPPRAVRLPRRCPGRCP